MMASLSFPEEECFSVFWKIKEFSYCCWQLKSPEFPFGGNQYFLKFIRPDHLECSLECLVQKRILHFSIQISFMTCDGSPEKSVSGDKYKILQVLKAVVFDNRRASFLPEDTLTVRLRIPTDLEFARGKIFIHSQIAVKRKYFLWTIPDFNFFQSTHETLKKSIEESENYGHMELCLNFMADSDGKISVDIYRMGGEVCQCSLQISVLDSDGKARLSANDHFDFDEQGPQLVPFPLTLEASKLNASKTQMLPEDTLSFRCTFAMSLGISVDQEIVLTYFKDALPVLKEPGCLSTKENNVTELQTDLKSMLDDGALFDVSLQIASDVVKAHRTILSARSPVFRAMFTKDMQETASSTVVIEDLSVETVRALLLYIYTDTVGEYQWEDLKELYFAADKYEVMGLREKCSSFIKSILSSSSACEALSLADLHGDESLKTFVLNYISDHYSNIFGSVQWKELAKNNSPLALEVVGGIRKDKRIKLK